MYDRRVQAAIEQLGLTLTDRPGRYGRYRLISDLLDSCPSEAGEWVPRDVDVALFTIGGPGSTVTEQAD